MFDMGNLVSGLNLVTLIMIGVLSIVSAIVAVAALRRMGALQDVLTAVLDDLRLRGPVIDSLAPVLRDEGRLSREELQNAIAGLHQVLEIRLTGLGQLQGDQLSQMRRDALEGRTALEGSLKQAYDGFGDGQSRRLGELTTSLKESAERLERSHVDARTSQAEGLEAIRAQIGALLESNEKRQDAIRTTLTDGLDQLRKDNGSKLEQMRATVDEKLHNTLEARLGESFKIVSDRLEQVHRGLGEMQNLATGVGDLKRVLVNVKARGGWGEVQLSTLLEDMLTPEQYAHNVKVRPESSEMVEFAIKLPGSGDDPMYLPIDAKFPHEDYSRLVSAQEAGNPEEVEKAAAALERAVRLQAKLISEKYIHPPHTTDFAVCFLPTEGLFAELIRRPGLVQEIQNTYRVTLTGPTTLAALLTSLQMGFRTLAIQQRSSEVWQVLGAAKAEFRKYGVVWDKLHKQLETAQRTVEEAGTRTRAIERKLRNVELLEGPVEVVDDVGEDDAASETASELVTH